MEKNDYLKNTIINDNRHLFVYGKETKERDNFIDEIIEEYPPIIGENKPVAIKIDDFGLPNVKTNIDKTNYYKLSIVSSEYLYLDILSKTIKSILDNNDIDLVDKKFNAFINYINRLCKSYRSKDYFCVNEILDIANQDMNFYKEYIATNMEDDIYSVVNLSIYDINNLIYIIKNNLENNNHFALIFDNKINNNYSLYSIKAINQLIGSRINDNISIRIVTEPQLWGTFLDLDGNNIQSTHDYGDVDLDNSLKKYISNNKKKLKINN